MEGVKIDKNRSILLVLIVILVAILCISIGFIFYTLNSDDSNDINTNIQSKNENSSLNNTNNDTPTWHSIKTYSGTTSNNYETHDFSSKNGKIKVTFSGTPQKNYGDNELLVYVVKYYNNGGALTKAGESSLNWGSTDAVETKEDTLEINSESNEYSIQITPTNMQTWTVTVWDYY